jgi:hypothetical protein
MTDDKSIFGQNFKSRDSLRPGQEEITAFLERTTRDGSREVHAKDLEQYRQLIQEIESFEHRGLRDRNEGDLRELMRYGVLGHAQFASTAFLAAVELYKYHLHALASLDFKTPASFIMSAENEMGRLSKKRLNDVMRMARLQEMVAERKKIIEELKRQWVELAAELRRIALYIRDNLSRIGRLCETSIVVLAETGIGQQKEKQLIEEIKNLYKIKFKEALHRGNTSRQDLENAKEELDLLTTEMSIHAREDADVLTRSYETLLEQVKRTGQELDTVLAQIEHNKSGSVLESTELFKRIEAVLVSLISDCRIDPKPSGIHTDTPNAGLLKNKRKEMLNYLFEQVRKERRVRKDRRSLQERRKNNKPDYAGPERRRTKERRTAGSRRS